MAGELHGSTVNSLTWLWIITPFCTNKIQVKQDQGGSHEMTIGGLKSDWGSDIFHKNKNEHTIYILWHQTPKKVANTGQLDLV